MKTEEEARETWCCGPEGCGKKRSDGTRWCGASDCMGWRWGKTHVKNPDAPDGDLVPSTRTYGFCGLAGLPFAGYDEP